jgi:hypothetical protein
MGAREGRYRLGRDLHFNAAVIHAHGAKSTRKRRLKMSLSSRGFFIVLILSFVLGLAGCQQEGTGEKAGKQIDKAAEKAGKAIEDQGKR